MGADFEYFAEVTQGTDIHQVYKELNEECTTLLSMSPPSTPPSPTPLSPFI